jgi:uncharacterized protein (TIGR03067 family)
MRRLLLLAALASLAFAPVPKPKPRPPRNDLEALQGRWYRVSLIIKGEWHKERPGAVAPTIKDNLMAYGARGDTWDFTLDPKKSPKRIDFRNTTHRGSYQGVYKLEGDTLTICWREGEKEADRPADFDPRQKNVWLHVYKRKKP